MQTPSKQFSEILSQEARSPGTVRIPPARRFAPIGWMTVVGFLMLGILAGVAGYAVVQDVVASDQERLLDDLAAAWTSGDEAALREVYAEDAVLVSPEGTRYEGIDAIVDLGRTMAVSGFAAERTSGVVVGGAGDRFAAATFDLSTRTETLPAVSLFEIVDGKVLAHYDFGY